MDDLEELQTRVAAAQEKLRLSADDQRKYGLRLNDVVAIVEGSLARQQEEMKRLQSAALELRIERDAARQAETELKATYDAALAKLTKHQAQNDQLRAMVLTLLNVIEGREPATALQGVTRRLETSLKQFVIAAPAVTTASEADGHDSSAEEDVSTSPFPAPLLSKQAEAELSEPEEHAAEEAVVEMDAAYTASGDDFPDDAEDAGIEPAAVEPELAGHDVAVHDVAAAPSLEEEIISADSEMPEAAAHEVEAEQITEEPAFSADQPEDLETISMTEHESLVADPEALADPEAPAEDVKENGADHVHALALHEDGEDEPLVSALLDAEKALIEAGANGFANGSSPVAEIIRRISLRTREFSEASGS